MENVWLAVPDYKPKATWATKMLRDFCFIKAACGEAGLPLTD